MGGTRRSRRGVGRGGRRPPAWRGPVHRPRILGHEYTNGEPPPAWRPPPLNGRRVRRPFKGASILGYPQVGAGRSRAAPGSFRRSPPAHPQPGPTGELRSLARIGLRGVPKSFYHIWGWFAHNPLRRPATCPYSMIGVSPPSGRGGRRPPLPLEDGFSALPAAGRCAARAGPAEFPDPGNCWVCCSR